MKVGKRTVRLTALLLVALLLMVALLLWGLSIGITLDGTRFVDPLRSTLERTVGHRVAFDGAVTIRVSTHPRIEIQKLRLLNPQSFKSLTSNDQSSKGQGSKNQGGDFATIDKVVLAVDAWSLMRGELIVEELTGDGAKIQLQRRLDGTNNWSPDPALSGVTTSEPTQESASASRAVAVELLQLRDIKVHLKNETKPDKHSSTNRAFSWIY